MNAQPPPLVSPNAGPVTGAVNAVASAATNAANTVVNAASGAINVATTAANNIFGKPSNNNKKNNMFRSNIFANAPANAGRNNAASNVPIINSIIPLGSNSPPDTRTNVGVMNSPPTFQFNEGATLFSPLNIFIGLIFIFIVVFAIFTDQLKRGYEYLTGSFKRSIGIEPRPDVTAPTIPVQGVVQEITVPPSPPQNITPVQQVAQQTFTQNIAEKLLPSSGGNEVYNVAQNKFTYYDAEPLCKALGAELATYDQVKDAWHKGADWCNYGWVKGQMAVYPTQKNTYDKLQLGPADEQGACGTVGINGGFFDNPDMRYGVNCYGKKPSQSAHDQKQLMEEGKIPRSPETLKVDEMTRQLKSEAESAFLQPFNDNKWASS
jgi:hypothetical protein